MTNFHNPTMDYEILSIICRLHSVKNLNKCEKVKLTLFIFYFCIYFEQIC